MDIFLDLRCSSLALCSVFICGMNCDALMSNDKSQFIYDIGTGDVRGRAADYRLHIAEDDGEVDSDFPCLDIREPVSKFGFCKLALMVHAPLPGSGSPYLVTMYAFR